MLASVVVSCTCVASPPCAPAVSATPQVVRVGDKVQQLSQQEREVYDRPDVKARWRAHRFNDRELEFQADCFTAEPTKRPLPGKLLDLPYFR